jgi:TolB-like protein
MKKFACFFVITSLSICLFVNCVTTKNNDLFGLDAAINDAANTITDNLSQGTKIAVVNFTSTSTAFSEYVIEELSIALAGSKKLVVIDRKELELIRSEMNFQMSGEVDDNSISDIGRILGAQYIITGSFADAGTYFRLRANAVNVENAVKEAPVSIKLDKTDKQITFFFQNETPQNNSPVEIVSYTQNMNMIQVKNSTGIDGYYLYIRSTGTNAWGKDLLDDAGVYIIDNGDTDVVSLENSINTANRYDLRMVDYDDNIYIKRNIQFTPDRIIEFTRNDMD